MLMPLFEAFSCNRLRVTLVDQCAQDLHEKNFPQVVS